MIRQVIVAEGKSDAAVITRAVEADVMVTEGYTLRPAVLADLRAAYERRGLIILTDPDGPGERIRARLAALFPEALHAFVPKAEAQTEDDVGVENASPEAIREALAKVRVRTAEPSEHFSAADLFAAGLSGCGDAAERRARVGAALGIGYGNARQFVKRLNHFGVTEEEWRRALALLEEESHA